MLVPLLFGILLVAASGGWLVGRVTKRRHILLAAWVLLPVLLYLVTALIIGNPASWRQEVGWVFIGLGFVGLPMLVWAGAAVAGFFVGSLRDDT